ncbi:hypothetical protein LCGC14_0447890 [marine sediment metagenome]|uniref:Uncharacterized protein n=1 Tax=marine sediment metagenome TaxID=412755 RepID=A0A0F9SPA3_9ZZZZ
MAETYRPFRRYTKSKTRNVVAGVLYTNERKYNEAVRREKELEPLRRAKAQYQPGGGFGKGVETGLERGRVKAVSVGMQNLVSAGLAGTTMAAGLGTKFEEEVAAPTRASLEEERARAISGIEMQEAGMGFQAGQAGLQRGFQAGQARAQRGLQKYIADLQADLQRESMAFQSQPTAQPVQQAQQFPALYGQDQGGNGAQSYPGLDDGGSSTADTPWPTPAPLFKEQYAPQTGDYMSVAGGSGGPILGRRM